VESLFLATNTGPLYDRKGRLLERGPVNTTGTDNQTVRVAVLLSGSGRTLANLLEHTGADDCPIEIVHVISTRGEVAGNDIARNAGVPLDIIRRRTYDDSASFNNALFKIIDSADADLVVCAGFLSKLVVPDRYLGRIVNIHPSLLPLFGGKGYYGSRVHQAVLESGMRVSGCTVHFVDNAYDAGPIIAQQCVPVEPDDTAESLARRVFDAECRLYPQVIFDVARGNIQLDGRTVQYHCARM
jgi:phosphoribosylglycinamide formyltransferase 1